MRRLLLGLGLVASTASAQVKIDVLQATAPTSTGTQTYTISGFGDVDAVILLAGSATTNDTATAHNVGAVGLIARITSTTVDEVSVSWCNEDAVGTSDASNRTDTGNSLIILDPADGTGDWVARYDSFTTDGIVLDWTTVTTGGKLVTMVFFGGLDSQHADLALVPMNNGSDDVTEPGFQPDVVFLANAGSIATGSLANGYGATLGFCVDSGASTDEAGSYMSSSHGASTQAVSGRQGPGQPADDNSVLIALVDCNTFDSSGFTLTSTASSAPGITSRYAYLAIESSDSNWDFAVTQNKDTPTSTGTQAYTGVGFEPDHVFMVSSALESWDTYDGTDDAGTLSWGYGNDTNSGCVGWSEDDGASTMVTDSYTSATKIDCGLATGGGSSDHFATLDSLDSDGFTLNFSAVDAAAKKVSFLALKTEAAAATGQPMWLRHITIPHVGRGGRFPR